MNRFVDNDGWTIIEPKEDSDKSIHKIEHKNEARRIAIWKAFDSKATSKEGEFIQAVKRYSATQKKRVIEALNSKRLDDAISSGVAYALEIESALNTVFDDKANKALKSALAPAWLDAMDAGRQQTYDMIGKKPEKSIDKAGPKVTPSLSVTNAAFNAFVEENGLLKAEGINDTTNEALREKLAQAISDGISNGDNLNTIKNRILDICESVYEDMDSRRAKLIGRNESMSSVNFGSYSTASAEGMESKEWGSAHDERVREDHLDADGQIVGINEPFNVGGEELMYPGDSSLGASAENTIQCRCILYYHNSDIDNA